MTIDERRRLMTYQKMISALIRQQEQGTRIDRQHRPSAGLRGTKSDIGSVIYMTDIGGPNP